MIDEYYGVVYKITNKINNKIYIGQTIQSIENRFNGHCSQPNVHKKMPIAWAIKKYGKENFKIEVIYYAKNKNDLNEKEMYYINFYNSRKKDIGYNISTGGSAGNNYCASIRKKSNDHCQKISKSKKGKKQDLCVVLKHASMAKDPIPTGYIYKKRKNKSIKQIKKSESKIKEKNPMYGIRGEKHKKSIKIISINLKSGLISEILGIQEASRIIGVEATKICAVLKEKRRTSNGYVFYYA